MLTAEYFIAVDVAITWFPQSTIMDDKHRSEIQKPVKNTLLSGASHGFPFENFQGSSLLIPVSQDSPSVLSDNAGDAEKLSPKPLIGSESFTELKESLSTTALEALNDVKPTQTISQSYTGLFSSFFSGGSQKKQESEFGEIQGRNSVQSSVPPPSQLFVTVPPVQSFSPVLQVPTSEHVQNETSIHSTGVSTSVPCSQTPGPPNFDTFSASNKNCPVPPLFPQPNVFVASKEPEENQVQNFFNKQDSSNADLVGKMTPSDIGFESFYNALSDMETPNNVLTKAQSAVDLIGGSSAIPSKPSAFPNTLHPQISAPQFYQMRTGSADSITAFQTPPVSVAASVSAPLAAPPMSIGVATRNYRRDHHKRLAYAQVPGLTSNTAVSSSYLQLSENFSNPTSVSSSILTSSSAVIKHPISGSLSQPAMSFSGVSSDLLTEGSSTSSSSLQNFFSPIIPSSTAKSVDSFLAETTTPFQIVTSQTFTSATSFNSVISNASASAPVSAPPIALGSTCTVSPHAFHAPIMSTREQPEVVPPPVKRTPSPVVIPPSLQNLANLGTSGIIYRPVYHHWFLRIEVKDSKEIWQPFSMTDSLALEQAFNSDSLTPETVVSTDGGRYDVNVTNRIRTAVYWKEESKTVRRCSWFYKSTTESRLHPYDENTAYNLEEEYKKAVTTNTWNRKVDLPNGDYVLMYGPSSMALFQSTPDTPEGWEAEPVSNFKNSVENNQPSASLDYSQTEQRRPKIIKRGVLDDFDIDEGESPVVDHLIFVVHGIGSVCDFRFRTIEEAVDGFRTKSLQLIKSHFRTSLDEGIVNRIEILPVSWHNHLHGENTGVDKKLQTITLKSIPRLRNFTNDTLLDILFYTSPVYCQNIIQQVGGEINTLYAKFKERNPNFTGGCSLVGHSLGSLILFDMLCHQKPPSPRMENIKEETKRTVVQHDVTTLSPDKKKRSLSRNVSYVIGNAGTGQPFIEYPQFSFQPLAFFAMGSPIGMFVTVRGIDSLGLDFCLPTCSRFFNVFHPFDPVAYRIEALINPDLADKRPVLIPHHKGRKRMHLELKETMARVGADLKQRLVDSVRSTWNTVYQLTMFGRADDGLEQEVDKVIEKQLERQRSESVGNGMSESEETDFNAGRLNQGRRIDYVLQEAPLESFNEYVSALTSHVIYWDSEDTMLLILKEIYGSCGISADNQQNGLPNTSEPTISSGVDPGASTSTGYKSPASYGSK